LGDPDQAKRVMVDVGLFQDFGPGSDGGSNGDGILEAVARKKGVTAAGFLAYGAKVEGQAVCFPMFGPDGEQCSTFTLTLGNGKGLYGAGLPTGLFLPSRKPQAGETWGMVEGVKDAAALYSLGILAAGLPSNRLSAKFAPVFKGVDVVIVPDADDAGASGAEGTAKVLRGVARSLRIGRLPVEHRETHGDDVRDVLRDQGSEAVRKAIAEAKPAGAQEQAPSGTKPKEPPAFTRLLTGTELLALDLRPRFLVRGVLVEGQPMIVGGRSKTLKTSVAVDLALSLSSDRPFLGRFDSRGVGVGFWSGESGAATIRETALRVAATKGVKLEDCDCLWCFDLPRLSHLDHLDHLSATIRGHGLRVAILDPLYLALLSPETASGASNLFLMGSMLQGLTKLAGDTGCTIVLLHHFRKGGQPDEDNPAGLEELAQSGVAEWARQWILLQRRVPYGGDGKHALWMRVGGSAGHSSLWGVNIDEGQLDPDTFSGRTWDVSVSPAADAREATKRDREQRKAVEQEQREGEHRERLLTILRQTPGGETERQLAKAARLNTDNFGRAIFALVQEGRAARCEVTKGGRSYEAFKPTGR
jgi:replicative DNA helicase